MVKRNYTKDELLNYTEREPNLTNFEGKEIFLHFNSFCLGDSICFSSYLDAFLDIHKPSKVIVSTFLPHLFESQNDRIEIVNANQKKMIVADKLVNVGYDKGDLNHTLGGMFYATKDTMMIPQHLKPGKVPVIPKERNINHKKIVIAPESIKHIARWDFFGSLGWQKVVDYLNASGYEVYNVSYEDTLKLNGVKGYHGFDDINLALGHILEAKIFIGLSSGLAWLAWAYGVPVVMISNFTKTHNEFDCYRVENPFSCSGCFNIFPNISSKCPLFLNTNRENECHKKITPQMVLNTIGKALSEN